MGVAASADAPNSREACDESVTTKLAGILGLTVALALSGVPQQSAAQTSGAEKQTKETKQTRQRTVRTRQPREPAASAAQARARDGSGTSSLPGYSARPGG